MTVESAAAPARAQQIDAANRRQRWLVLATLFVVMLFLIGSTAMTVPIFFLPLAKQYGWSHARTSLLPTVFVLLLGGAAPIAGWLLDRVPARLVMGTGAAMIAIGLLMAGRTHSFGPMLAAWTLMGAGGAASTVVPCALVAANWFGDNRGLAIGATLSGSGTGGIVLPPLTDYLIRNYSISTAFFVLAVPIIVIVLPMILLVIRARPAGAVKSTVAEEVARLPGLELKPAHEGGALLAARLRTINREHGFGRLLLPHRTLPDSCGILTGSRRADPGRHYGGGGSGKSVAWNNSGSIQRTAGAALCPDGTRRGTVAADRRRPFAELASLSDHFRYRLRYDRGRNQFSGSGGGGRNHGTAALRFDCGPTRFGSDGRAEHRHDPCWPYLRHHRQLFDSFRTRSCVYIFGCIGCVRHITGSGHRGDTGLGDRAGPLTATAAA